MFVNISLVLGMTILKI